MTRGEEEEDTCPDIWCDGGSDARHTDSTHGRVAAVAQTSMMPASHVYTSAALAKLALHYADQSALVKIFEFQSRHLSDKLVLDCVLAVILWPDKASHLNPSSPGGQ